MSLSRIRSTTLTTDGPLAAYYFGYDKAEEKRFLTGTTSAVLVSTCHVPHTAKRLAIWWRRSNGMGAYHGIEGFKTFSHAKGVYRQPKKIQSQNLQALYTTATHPEKHQAKSETMSALNKRARSDQQKLFRRQQIMTAATELFMT